jgi:hypothetical protein
MIEKIACIEGAYHNKFVIRNMGNIFQKDDHKITVGKY